MPATERQLRREAQFGYSCRLTPVPRPARGGLVAVLARQSQGGPRPDLIRLQERLIIVRLRNILEEEVVRVAGPDWETRWLDFSVTPPVINPDVNN